MPRTRLGLFAAVGLCDWSERVILPHEHTMPKPKADRLEPDAGLRRQHQPDPDDCTPIRTASCEAILEGATATSQPVGEARPADRVMASAADEPPALASSTIQR